MLDDEFTIHERDSLPAEMLSIAPQNCYQQHNCRDDLDHYFQSQGTQLDMIAQPTTYLLICSTEPSQKKSK